VRSGRPAAGEPPAPPERFERRSTVEEADIDELGHVNNVVYVRWIQDVAAAHWRAAATPEQRDAVVWVAVRHEIDYEAPAFPGEEVVARTWVEAWTGATSERRTEIVRDTDGKVLARGRTIWCALDARTRRPCRVGADVRGRFVEGGR
jgi:acyl-CoA thioester hydrolase